MPRKVYLADALNGSTEEQIDEFLKAMKKKELIYGLLTIIPGVNWITGAFFIFIHNTIRVIESNGHKQPGGFVSICAAIWSWLLPPLVVGFILNRLPEGAQNGILGVNSLLKQYHY